MQKTRNLFYLITIVTFICIFLNIPTDIKIKKTISLPLSSRAAASLPAGRSRDLSVNIKKPTIQIPLGNKSFVRDLNFKKGLDLQGGMRVTLKANMDKIEEGKRITALESARAVISRRVDLYGVSESTVKTSIVGSEYRLIIELPGVENPKEALDLVGQTASLVFAVPVYEADKASPSAEPKLKQFAPSDLTGSDLESASVTFESQDRSPAVALKFKESGRDKFAKITKEFLNKPVAITLDQEIISAPIVQSEIVSGDAIISGRFTIDEAKFLATQLNAGALPVPISVLSQQNISATLGESSIRQSLIAGGIGLGIVVIFMSLFYGIPGIIASIGLLIYGLITATLYKLIPVTLTLPGIAGFILSVGMAVDSNILIFERLKEELRAGRSFAVALELAFGRAWDSIKDANIATIITGLILFNPLDWSFLNTSGAVRGFALTLLIGIFTSLFTGVIATRTLLRLFYHGPRPRKDPL